MVFPYAGYAQKRRNVVVAGRLHEWLRHYQLRRRDTRWQRLRDNRLALLRELQALFLAVADLSRLVVEG